MTATPGAPARKNTVGTWLDLGLCSFGALLFGTAIVSTFVALLSLYGISPSGEHMHHFTVTRGMKFPDNASSLDDMASQLAKDGAALSRIEPAAGDKKPTISK